MVKDRTLARASRVLAGSLRTGLLVTGLIYATTFAHAQGTSAAAPSDAQLQAEVTSALAADSQLRGQQITASVAQGVVTLSGAVASDGQRTAAEQTTAQVKGVRSIDDSLAVGGDPNLASAGQEAAVPAQQPSALAQQPDQASPAAPETSTSLAPQGPGMPPPPPADAEQQQPQTQYPEQSRYPQQQYPQQQPGPYGSYAQPPVPYGYGAPRGQYAAPPPPRYVPGVSPEKQDASGPVTLNPGLLLNVRTSEPLSTGRLKTGEPVQFTAASDLYANGVVAVPRGAVLTGQVVEAKNAGPFAGSPRLDLRLTTLTLGNQTYPLVSDVWSSQGPGKGGYTAANTVGGAAFGALAGALAGGGTGAGIGAAAGGAGGLLVSGATHGPRLDLPAEALLQFHLTAPLTVQPVDYHEAERLAASVPQRPVLRPRPVYAIAPYPYYARPYYPYPYYYGRY